MSEMPDWFGPALSEAMRQDHYDLVDSRSRLWRWLHSLRKCPACEFRHQRYRGDDDLPDDMHPGADFHYDCGDR